MTPFTIAADVAMYFGSTTSPAVLNAPARHGDQQIEYRPDGREKPVRRPPSRLVELLVPFARPKDRAGRRRAEARCNKAINMIRVDVVHLAKLEEAACVSSSPFHRLPVPLCCEFAGAH